MQEYAYKQRVSVHVIDICNERVTNSAMTKVRDGAQNVHHRPWLTLIGDKDEDKNKDIYCNATC